MSRRASRRALGMIVAAGAALVLWTTSAHAQVEPRITLDRVEVGPGEPFLVTFEGFDSQFVDIVLCGNLGYRGAADCAVTAGVSKETASAGRPRVVQMIAHPPPTHCPCIVKATASAGGVFAVAPIVITGHPVGDIEGVPDGPLLEIEIDVTEAGAGFWGSVRSALGGPTRYVGSVSVRNTTAETLENVELTGSVGHWIDDDAVELDLAPPGSIAPGETWSQDVSAEVSAPSLGTFTFEVVASGAGSSVVQTRAVSHQPWLFYVLAAVLIVDVVVALGRWIAKRSAARAEIEDELAEGSWDESDWEQARSDEEPVLV